MDDDVCTECRSETVVVTATLDDPATPTNRRWRECTACGWESMYTDEVVR